MEAKQPIQFAGDMQLRQPQLDVQVKGIGNDFGAKFAFSPACLLPVGKWLRSFDIGTDGSGTG